MIDKAIKEKLKAYKKQLIKEDNERKLLINSETNWTLLESLIQKCNANPQLRVDIRLKDGTIINLKTVAELPKIDPYADEVIEVQ